MIQVDSSEKATGGTFAPQYPESDSVFNKALGWAKRQWRRWLP
jgi:hypothetical protein